MVKADRSAAPKVSERAMEALAASEQVEAAAAAAQEGTPYQSCSWGRSRESQLQSSSPAQPAPPVQEAKPALALATLVRSVLPEFRAKRSRL